MLVPIDRLEELIDAKLRAAGLDDDAARFTAHVLAWADARGVHSHGVVRVEYYCERIAKGGLTVPAPIEITSRTPTTHVVDAGNGSGFVAARAATALAIETAREHGVAVVGTRRMGHSGPIGYYSLQLAAAGLVGLTLCQSDPMAVPFGGADPFFGTNPIAFAAPVDDDREFVVDMATTVQAWGKVLDARSRGVAIPDTWAVGHDGLPTTDPNDVHGLLPIAGPKGMGLMAMVDILSGPMLGLPFGPHVTSMYGDLAAGRELGQLQIALDPAVFRGDGGFAAEIGRMLDELTSSRPAEGVDRVRYPGQPEHERYERSLREGVDIVDELYEYLIGDAIHFDRYSGAFFS